MANVLLISMKRNNSEVSIFHQSVVKKASIETSQRAEFEK